MNCPTCFDQTILSTEPSIEIKAGNLVYIVSGPCLTMAYVLEQLKIQGFRPRFEAANGRFELKIE